MTAAEASRARPGTVRPLVRAPAWIAGMLQAIPDFCLSGSFLITWIAPYALGQKAVRQLVLVMLLEFIVIHSAGFMGMAAVGSRSAGRRLLVILGFGLFYTLFVGAFSLGFHTSWPFVSFWILTGNRMLGAVISPASDLREAKVVMSGWALTVVAYLGLVFATTLLPVPHFGITPEVVARQEWTGGGLWLEQPHRVLAFGFLYFLTTGTGEILLARNLKESE